LVSSFGPRLKAEQAKAVLELFEKQS
jgi:hypothetical protein